MCPHQLYSPVSHFNYLINDADLRHHWHLQTPLQPTDLLRYL